MICCYLLLSEQGKLVASILLRVTQLSCTLACFNSIFLQAAFRNLTRDLNENILKLLHCKLDYSFPSPLLSSKAFILLLYVLQSCLQAFTNSSGLLIRIDLVSYIVCYFSVCSFSFHVDAW